MGHGGEQHDTRSCCAVLRAIARLVRVHNLRRRIDTCQLVQSVREDTFLPVGIVRESNAFEPYLFDLRATSIQGT